MRNYNGYGGIVKLSGKRRRPYAVRITTGWTDDGKQIFKYLSYHEKKSEAKLALAEYNLNPYNIEATKITFSDVYEKWTAVEFKTLSDSMIKSYKSAYKHCAPLYDKVFRELRKDDLQAVVDAVKAKSMQDVVKFLFLKSYKYAMENDIVSKNYAQYVKIEKKEEPKEKVPFTKDEVNKLWENVNNLKYGDMVLILLYTGMRIGELLEMDKSNVHLEERYMVGGSKTKAGKNRIIPINKRILPLIEQRIKASDSPWLFTNRVGGKLNYSSIMQYHWKPVMDLLDNQELTPHSCRHAFISEMTRVGVDTLTIQKIVGHANKNVTEHYTHKHIEELVAAVDKLV